MAIALEIITPDDRAYYDIMMGRIRDYEVTYKEKMIEYYTSHIDDQIGTISFALYNYRVERSFK